MPSHEDRSTIAESVTPDAQPGDAVLSAAFPPLTSRPTLSRRGALGRLLGLGAGAVAASVLPATVDAAPVAQSAPAPVTVLPDWLQGQPDWLVANVEGYARLLATLTDPLTPWLDTGQRSREGQVLRAADAMIASMNAPDELAARPAGPETPRQVAQDRIVTIRIPRLDRNERARVRRWLAKLPTGETDPRVLYRLGYRARVHDELNEDFLHVVAPATRGWSDPSPREHAEQAVSAMIVGAKIDIERAFIVRFLCAHQSPTEHRARAWLYEWQSGEITTYAVRRDTA